MGYIIVLLIIYAIISALKMYFTIKSNQEKANRNSRRKRGE